MTSSGDKVFHILDDCVLDWGDFTTSSAASKDLLAEIAAEPRHLRELLCAAQVDRRLREMAETHRIDRLVLYDALDRGIRVRLHVYPADHRDGPHDHRWSFSARVLRGSYQHTIMSAEQGVSSMTNMQNLRPVYVREETPGSGYSLHHEAIHAVVAQPGTVSLVLRGPATKREMFMTDLETARPRWKTGRDADSPEEAQKLRMSDERFAAVRLHLERTGLV